MTKRKVISGKIIIIILFAVLFALMISLLVQTKIIENPFNKLSKTVEKRELRDICSIIGGKLIHSIEKESTCENICIAECDSIKGELDKFEFFQGENTCNKCSCYCKS